MKNNSYSIRGFKQMATTDAPALSGTVMNEKIKVLSFYDDGMGGEINVEILDEKMYEKFEKDAVILLDKKDKNLWKDDEVKGFLYQLMDKHEYEQKIKKLCKTRIVFTLNSGDPEEIFSYKLTGGNNTFKKHKHQYIKGMQERHGKDLKEIINFRYI